MAARLFVGNLSYSTTSEGLREHLEQCGEVMSAQVITDSNSGRSRGYAFVEMASDAEANTAISRLNGQALDGRNLKIEAAKPRSAGPEGPRRNPSGGGAERRPDGPRQRRTGTSNRPW